MSDYKAVHSGTELSRRITDCLEASAPRAYEFDERTRTIRSLNDILQSRSTRSVDELLAELDKCKDTRLPAVREEVQAFLRQKELLTQPYHKRPCQRHFKMSIFAEMGCRFLQGSIQVLYSLIHHITCRFEARQALIYQLASGLTGENGKYNYSKAVHLYPPFFDIFCSPKNYKTASALTVLAGKRLHFSGRRVPMAAN